MKILCLLMLKNGRYLEMPCKTCCPDIDVEGQKVLQNTGLKK